jgi:hypothetical protein
VVGVASTTAHISLCQGRDAVLPVQCFSSSDAVFAEGVSSEQRHKLEFSSVNRGVVDTSHRKLLQPIPKVGQSTRQYAAGY